TALAREVLTRARRVRIAGHAAARRQLDALDLHAGDRVWQEPADRRVAGAAHRQCPFRVMPERGLRLGDELLHRHAEGVRGAVQHSESRVALPRLEVRPRGAGHPGELGHLLLGGAPRLAELLEVAREPRGDLVAHVVFRCYSASMRYTVPLRLVT